MKKIISLVLMLSVVGLVLAGNGEQVNDSVRSFPIENYIFKADRNTAPSVDHSKFEVLQQTFENAHQVTEACLSCHTERDKEIMATSHWKWERDEFIEGKGIVPLGKKNILNNFCIGVAGSEATCTRCHI